MEITSSIDCDQLIAQFDTVDQADRTYSRDVTCKKFQYL